jgi:hypothetical protein
MRPRSGFSYRGRMPAAELLSLLSNDTRLATLTDDVAKIRRMLVDVGWLTRDRAGSRYEPSVPVRA